VRDLIVRAGHRHGIRIQRFVNVGNHLHLLVRTPNRPAFSNFLRQAAGHVAQAVTGAVKGNGVEAVPNGAGRRFWDALTYSRPVSWGRDLVGITAYFMKNLAEALRLADPRGTHGSAELKIARAGPILDEIWIAG
jgi:hypothetical protein